MEEPTKLGVLIYVSILHILRITSDGILETVISPYAYICMHSMALCPRTLGSTKHRIRSMYTCVQCASDKYQLHIKCEI